jgi:hypothetical protein
VFAAVSFVVAAATIAGEGVFTAGLVAGIACVSAAIPRFVSVEVVEPLFSALRYWPSITLTRVIAVIDMAEKAMRAAEPGTGSDENSTIKPVGPVVAIRGAIIGGVVEVAIGASGGRAKVDADRDLG